MASKKLDTPQFFGWLFLLTGVGLIIAGIWSESWDIIRYISSGILLYLFGTFIKGY